MPQAVSRGSHRFQETNRQTDNMTQKAIETASYVGGATSVLSALTLTDIGIVVGIVTALLTFVANLAYQWRRDTREQKEHEIRVGRMDRLPLCEPDKCIPETCDRVGK